MPIKFSGARTGFDDALPVMIGEHNSEVYSSLLGYTDQQIADLRDTGAI